jgi:hypothetical protein
MRWLTCAGGLAMAALLGGAPAAGPEPDRPPQVVGRPAAGPAAEAVRRLAARVEAEARAAHEHVAAMARLAADARRETACLHRLRQEADGR